MIYVLQTAQYNKEYEKVDAIKVGYTGNWETRRQAYEEYCHNFKVIQIYKDGTIEDETRLKIYFKDKIIYKNEWIEYSDKVIKFFETNDTLEKLRDSIKHIIIDTRQKRKTEIDDSLIRTIINDKFPDSDLIKKLDIIEKIEKDLEFLNSSEHIRFISSKYSISEELLNKNCLELKDRKDRILKDNKELSKDFKDFKSIESSTGRFKYLVDLYDRPDVIEENIKLLLEILPVKYFLFFTCLGPDRIKANNYRETNLKREWINLHSEDKNKEVSDKIYEAFKIGNKYSNSGAKITLNNLYSLIGIKKTAKASDLEDYFTVKSIKLLENDKWVHGLEILGKK